MKESLSPMPNFDACISCIFTITCIVEASKKDEFFSQVILYQERGLTPSGDSGPAGEPTYLQENCPF